MPFLYIPAAAVVGWFGGMFSSDNFSQTLKWLAIALVMVWLFMRMKGG